MIRCCFIGSSTIYDPGLARAILNELEKLLLLDEPIEIWLLGVHRPFLKICLDSVLLFKSKYPQKNITIVRIYALKKNNTIDLCDIADDKEFPQCIVDKVVFIHHMDRPVISENYSIQWINKIERWVIKQCNYIFAYYYPTLYDSINHQVHFARRQSGKTIILICFDNTSQFIQKQIEQLNGQPQQIFHLLNQGKNKFEIAKVVGISRSTVDTIVSKVSINIKVNLDKELIMRNKMENTICGIVCLNDNPSALQLVLFESLLFYLSTVKQIKEIWIDEKSCYTPYGDILASYIRYHPMSIMIKAITPIKSCKEDKGRNTITKYILPLYLSKVIGSETETYDKIIQKCDSFIIDSTCIEGRAIRELCALKGSVFAFDVSRNGITIDDQYL